MMQQVNLLADDLKPRREALSLRQLLAGWAAMAALLAVVSAWQAVSGWWLADDRGALQAQWQTLDTGNSRLRDNLQREPQPELVSEVETLRALFSNQAVLVEAVQGYESASERGFSGYLTELAAQQMEGIALSRIELRDGGAYIALSGETEKPVNVPQLLKRLSAGERFRGHRFDEFRLEAQDSGLLRFDIVGPAREHSG
ncbi:MAG: hypothetical protein U5Q16_12900 [Gammaproteobacteria bacterium]|nr:hypothetical protein [Gammaproteobacteria bacterium]